MNQRPTAFSAAADRLQRTAERSADFDQATATLARLIHFAAKSLTDEVNTALKTHGLNYPSYAVLVMLFGTADYRLTPGELAAATHEKPANLTRLCDELARQQLVRRTADPADRRRVQISLTPEGQRRLSAVLPVAMAVIQQRFACLTPTDQHQLARLLRQLVDGST
ncbi:MarR family winged helix-turn-helix transcriptional regulator [Halothiobacillus sp. DCM-1]|uniref:MarR family winged helix-turn-helix transcriptional regulator n=1 Tax=Halothiobacillus sp. DCM-1 TaxID=3112558 RepID=UPI0032470BD8